MAKATMTKNRRSKSGRNGNATKARMRSSTPGNGGRLRRSLAERKSIEQLAAEQGVKPTRLEDILGKGADLWKSDQEFEHFVEDIYSCRREDRELPTS
jgi:hypothetical protein